MKSQKGYIKKQGIVHHVRMDVDVAELVIAAKQDIAKVTAAERESQGISQEPAKETKVIPIKPTLRVQQPRPDQIRPSEDLNDDQLQSLTLQTMQDMFRRKWVRLDEKHKTDKIMEFSRKYSEEHGVEYMKLVQFLIEQVLRAKKIRAMDVQYDEVAGKILGIDCLRHISPTEFSASRKPAVKADANPDIPKAVKEKKPRAPPKATAPPSETAIAQVSLPPSDSASGSSDAVALLTEHDLIPDGRKKVAAKASKAKAAPKFTKITKTLSGMKK